MSWQDEVEGHCSFQPNISKASNMISHHNSMFVGSNQNFIERQEAFLQKKMVNQEVSRAKIDEDCTFQPIINDPSALMNLPMSHSKTSKQEYNPEQECTFQPKINQVSRVLAGKRGIEQLANPDPVKKKKVYDDAKKKEVKECTF